MIVSTKLSVFFFFKSSIHFQNEIGAIARTL